MVNVGFLVYEDCVDRLDLMDLFPTYKLDGTSCCCYACVCQPELRYEASSDREMNMSMYCTLVSLNRSKDIYLFFFPFFFSSYLLVLLQLQLAYLLVLVFELNQCLSSEYFIIPLAL